MWYHLQLPARRPRPRPPARVPIPGGGGGGGGSSTPTAPMVQNAAWCYPEPSPGRENLRDHVTFATGKGIEISSSVKSVAAKAVRSGRRSGNGSGVECARGALATDHDSQGSLPPLPAAAATGLTSVLTPRGAAGLLMDSGMAREQLTAPPPRRPVCFDPAHLSQRFLQVSADHRSVTCHTNCGRAAQGTAFMAPTFHMGHRYRIAIHVERKPGRMCYFIGVAPRRFDPDAGQAAIRESAYSLETLAASLHAVDRPCMVKGPPTFHEGSVVTMEVDLRNARSTLRFEGLAGGAVREMQLPSAATFGYVGFISLYNRGSTVNIEIEER